VDECGITKANDLDKSTTNEASDNIAHPPDASEQPDETPTESSNEESK